MNATELADYLDNNVEAMIMSEQTHIDQAATMLRQQQAAVETLQYLFEVAQEDFKTMNSRFVIEHVKQALKELGHEWTSGMESIRRSPF